MIFWYFVKHLKIRPLFTEYNLWAILSLCFYVHLCGCLFGWSINSYLVFKVFFCSNLWVYLRFCPFLSVWGFSLALGQISASRGSSAHFLLLTWLAPCFLGGPPPALCLLLVQCFFSFLGFSDWPPSPSGAGLPISPLAVLTSLVFFNTSSGA